MTAAPTDPTATSPASATVWRYEVRFQAGQADPIADRARSEAAEKLPRLDSPTARQTSVTGSSVVESSLWARSSRCSLT